MSTSRVGSVAVWLGLALIGLACSAAESEGDVDFVERTLDEHRNTGGRSYIASGGSRQTGGGSSAGSGGAVGGGGTGGFSSGTGGSTTPRCLTSRPRDGTYCSNVGLECNYDVVCTCVADGIPGSVSGVWQCVAGSTSGTGGDSAASDTSQGASEFGG